MLLKPEIKNEMIKQLNTGNSINAISRFLNLSKSTIYHYYKKIKGRKFKLAVVPADDKVLGEFLGAFAGDGGMFYDKKYWHYTISIYLHKTDDKLYSLYLKELIEKNFNKKVRVYIHAGSALRLTFRSKTIYKLIEDYLVTSGNKTLNISIKKPISELSDDFLIYFIRGLIDTDGHVDKYGKVILALISQNMIEQVAIILKKLGIDSKISLRKVRPNEHQLYAIRILKKDAGRYLSLIGFSNKYKEIRICASRDSKSRF